MSRSCSSSCRSSAHSSAADCRAASWLLTVVRRVSNWEASSLEPLERACKSAVRPATCARASLFARSVSATWAWVDATSALAALSSADTCRREALVARSDLRRESVSASPSASMASRSCRASSSSHCATCAARRAATSSAAAVEAARARWGSAAGMGALHHHLSAKMSTAGTGAQPEHAPAHSATAASEPPSPWACVGTRPVARPTSTSAARSRSFHWPNSPSRASAAASLRSRSSASFVAASAMACASDSAASWAAVEEVEARWAAVRARPLTMPRTAWYMGRCCRLSKPSSRPAQSASS